MSSGLAQILLLFGVLQALQLTIVLGLRAPRNQIAVGCLQTLLMACALLLVDYLLLTTGKYLQAPALAGFSLPLLFVLGPLLLGYVICLTGSKPRLAWLWHAVPALVCCAAWLFNTMATPDNVRTAWLADLLVAGYSGSPMPVLVGSLLLCLQLVMYSYHADQRLQFYDAALREQEAGSTVQLVRWLTMVTRGFCLFLVLLYLAWAEWLYLNPANWHYTSLSMLCLAALLVGTGLWSQLRPDLFFQAALTNLPALTPVIADDRYGKSRLDGDQLQACKAALEACMYQRQPHLDPELRLGPLAELAGMAPHVLSQVINQGFGCNFFEYINRQRVLHAQTLMQTAAKGRINLLELALLAGFNSKATFNRSFRQHAGMSPSEYLALQQKQQPYTGVNS